MKYSNHPEYIKIKNCKSLEELKLLLEQDKYLEIAQNTQNCVFSDGVEGSDIMIIGEAPGKSEDETGIPFCGRSGQLLDKLLLKKGLSRNENVYITNVVNWHPESNRAPNENEINYCLAYLEKHIALKNPKIILALGATANYALFRRKQSLGSLRGKKHIYKNYFFSNEIEVVSSFHPAYLLAQTYLKNDFLGDLNLLFS